LFFIRPETTQIGRRSPVIILVSERRIDASNTSICFGHISAASVRLVSVVEVGAGSDFVEALSRWAVSHPLPRSIT